MIFLICLVLVAAKLISCCRRWGKDLEEKPDDITWADIKTKIWFKALVFLRMMLMLSSFVMGYYYFFGYGEVDKWANGAVDSWDRHFKTFHHGHNVNYTISTDCLNLSETSIADNYKSVQNYSFGLSEFCLKNLYLDNDGIEALLNISSKKHSPKYPVLVTAASNESYQDVLDLIQNVQSVLLKTFPRIKLKLHVYDFGFNEDQRLGIGNITFCDLKRYPVDQLKFCGIRNKENTSSAINLENGKTSVNIGILKPSLIQMELHKNAFVMWVEPSTRFNSSGSFKRMVKSVKGKSLKLLSGESTSNNTDKSTLLNILGEDECLSKHGPAIDTSVVLIKRNNFTFHAVMKPWVSATFKAAKLTLKNHALKTSRSKTRKKFTNKTNDGSDAESLLERLDSSVLSIILTRLFGSRRHIFLFDLNSFGWHDVINHNSTVINYQ